MSISCRIVNDLLPIYIEGLTTEVSNKAIQDHLICCSSCYNIYQGLKEDVEVIKEEEVLVPKAAYYTVMKIVKLTLILVIIGSFTVINSITVKAPKPSVKIQLPSDIRAFNGSKIMNEFIQVLGNIEDKDVLLDQSRINISFTQDGVIDQFNFQLLTMNKRDVDMYSFRNTEPNENILKITKLSKVIYEINNSVPLKEVLSALEKITWDKILELNLSPAFYEVELMNKIKQGISIDTRSNNARQHYYCISTEGVVTKIDNNENFVLSKDTYVFTVTPMFKVKDSYSSFSGEGIALYYVEVNKGK
ncbi:MAG: zf-HC2 domain-containing protein [Clostridiaceae bacterium]|nr:zf-HC2 domain-containing protein [Clostridiaceae bacterium]